MVKWSADTLTDDRLFGEKDHAEEIRELEEEIRELERENRDLKMLLQHYENLTQTYFMSLKTMKKKVIDDD